MCIWQKCCFNEMFPNPVFPFLGPVAIPLNSIFPILPLSVELQHSTDLHPSHGDARSPLAERRKGTENFCSQGKHGGSGRPSASPWGDAKATLTSACRTDSWERWVVELGTGRVGPEEEPLCSTAGVPRLPTHLLSSQALQGPGTMAGCPWVSYIGASLGWRGGQVGLHWGRREGGDGRGGEKEGRASGKGRE